MKRFKLLAQGVNVDPILAEIDAQPELWNQHDMRTTLTGTAHADVDDIWLRYNAWKNFNPEHPEKFGNRHVPVWYPAAQTLPAIKPHLHAMMAAYQGEMLGGVLITRVPPGKQILPHADRGWHVEYYDKFYLSLRNAPGSHFICEHEGEKETINPRPGELYRFDNRVKHWVVNESDEDRITLIVCIRTDMFKNEHRTLN